MKIDKLLKLVKTLKPTAFEDEILLMWVNEIEGMVLNEIHLVAVADLTPYELGENGEVPTAELTAPYPYDKLYTQYLLAQIDYANGEYSKYQNTMEMFNACYTDYVHYVAEVLAPADGRATLLQYYLSAYAIAKNHGYAGTEEQWLASLHGEAGKSVVMRYQDKLIQWAQEGAAWENLIDMQDIQDAITQDAQEAIQDATETAMAAKTAAEAAKSAAQTAQAGAEAAKASAQSSAGDALQSARYAIQAADDAEISAAGAAGDAAAAEAAKATAQTAATEAAAQKAAASSSAGDAEAWSQGTRGGAAVGTADETYHNNAKYWAQQAAASGGEGGEVTKEAVIGALGYTPADINNIPAKLPNPQPLEVTIDGFPELTVSYDGSALTSAGLGMLALASVIQLDNQDAVYVEGILQISNGGTGAVTVAGARSNLGLGSLATKSNVRLGGSDVTGTLPITKGGTGAATAAEALTALGGLPLAGGTMVNSGDKKGLITFPGINTLYRTGRDDAAIKVQYPSGGSADKYVPIFSGKGKTCSWEAAIYGDKVNLAQIGDTEYAAGINEPKTLYTIGEDGITGIQGWQLVANGSMSQGSTLSGSADNSKYKTVHVLFGSQINGSNYYQSYDFPLPAEADFWNIYIPALNDYFRARIDITEAGGITVTMQSDASRQCFIYVSV